MFAKGLQEFEKNNTLQRVKIDETAVQCLKSIKQYKIAILLESKLNDDKNLARLEMVFDFYQEDMTNGVESYFVI